MTWNRQKSNKKEFDLHCDLNNGNSLCLRALAIKTSVPQGSLLGSIFFLFYINDLYTSIICEYLCCWHNNIRVHLPNSRWGWQLISRLTYLWQLIGSKNCLIKSHTVPRKPISHSIIIDWTKNYHQSRWKDASSGEAPCLECLNLDLKWNFIYTTHH